MKGGGIAAVALGLMTTLAAWRGGEAAAARDAAAQPPGGVEKARVAAADVRPVVAAGAIDGRATYADIVDKVSPAVVTVRVEGRATPMPTSGQTPDIEEFRRFFGPQFRFQQPRRVRGLGSGVIVSRDGYILTNNHVIEGASEIHVETKDRRALDAKLIGADPATDLAVIKVTATALPTVAIGDSDRVRVGDVVLAFGNPLNVGQTVTMGIVSAKGRSTGLGDGSFEDFLQTDAAINQGNSGGALVNLSGELVGINTQMISSTGANIGLGFSIPVKMARNVMDQLIQTGKVQRAKLGVGIQPVTADIAKAVGLSEVRGAIVGSVESNSAAARAGLKVQDVILDVDGKPIADGNELRNAIASTKPGTTVALRILREGRQETVRATLGELQPSKSAVRGSDDDDTPGGAFGLTVEPVTPDLAARLDLPRGTKGVAVTDVEAESEAEASGLRPGDVIQKVNGQDVASVEELRGALKAATADKPALLLVSREGRTAFVTLRAPRG